MSFYLVRPFLVLMFIFSLTACKGELLPNTNLEDTSAHRSTTDFMEKYRSAVESRSAEKVINLVSDSYFEDNANVNQEDDYGVERLKKSLEDNFSHVEAIKLTLFIQHVEYENESKDGKIHVYYRYMQRSLLDLPSGQKWVSHSDVNELLLLKKDDSEDDSGEKFEIVAGL